MGKSYARDRYDDGEKQKFTKIVHNPCDECEKATAVVFYGDEGYCHTCDVNLTVAARKYDAYLSRSESSYGLMAA